jgi:hypothetical protein
MKNFIIIITALIISFLFSSCSVVGDIFNAGMSVGIFITVFIIGLIIYVIVRGSRNNK